MIYSFYLVYENSEDIAMTSNADNVYSNTKYTPKTDQEQRGYKVKKIKEQNFYRLYRIVCIIISS